MQAITQLQRDARALPRILRSKQRIGMIIIVKRKRRMVIMVKIEEDDHHGEEKEEDGKEKAPGPENKHVTSRPRLSAAGRHPA